MAIDYGSRRMGLAVTDPLGITAQGLPTLQRKNIRADLAGLSRIVKEKGVDRILIGNPLHMSGDAGRCTRFAPASTSDFAIGPTSAIVSLLYVMEDGASAEIAVVGYEGIVGISRFMGGESTPSRAVVQSGGNGLRLKASFSLDRPSATPCVRRRWWALRASCSSAVA